MSQLPEPDAVEPESPPSVPPVKVKPARRRRRRSIFGWFISDIALVLGLIAGAVWFLVPEIFARGQFVATFDAKLRPPLEASLPPRFLEAPALKPAEAPKPPADAKLAADPERPVMAQRVVMVAAKPPRILVGTLRARVEADQGFRIAGKIETREVQLGDRVKAGTVLARLDVTDLRLQRQSADAELAAAKSIEKQAEAERDRIAALRKQGWSTDQAVDRQRSVLDEAIGRRTRAQRQVELAANAQSYADLVAEHDGVVIGLFAEAGQVVAAGQAIIRIARDGDREAQVAIPEQDLEEARVGKAEAALWSAPGRAYPTKLRELSPNADTATRTFQARFLVEGLPPDAPLGMTVTLKLADRRNEQVARVPLSAILNEGNGAEVFVVAEGTGELVRRKVEVVGLDQRDAFVSHGLAEGERVVTLGVHKLRAGLKVRVIADARLG